MENKRFKPMVDKLYHCIWIPTVLLLIGATAVSALSTLGLWIMLAVDVFALYFLISSLFGYVELRESTVFIKLGFIMTREIPYFKIREITKERRLYADSIVALKHSLEHVNIKYNRFDVISVSVVNNDAFISLLEEKISANSDKKANN